MSNLYSNSIFWIDTDKIKPNPFQPRRDFDEARMEDLALSIKQYGVLQPLTVSRVELEKEEGGLVAEYELIAGERRLRAAKRAGVSQVPVIIRVGDTSMMKLELAIIENLQREDLNVVDRARAFLRLVSEFKFTHAEVAKKMGRSREYVSNSLRILSLPEEILKGLSEGRISEGHTRPLLMLVDHPEEQLVLFKEIVYKKITVREAEKLARKIAYDRVRKKEFMPDPEISELEEEFQDKLGTRVHIERKELGGQIKIDYFSTEDLRAILTSISKGESEKNPNEMLENYISKINPSIVEIETESIEEQDSNIDDNQKTEEVLQISMIEEETAIDDRSKEEINNDINKDIQEEIKIESNNIDESSQKNTEPEKDESNLYDISNFSL